MQATLLNITPRSLANVIRRPKSIHAVSEVRTHGLRMMRPTRCQLRYHCLSIYPIRRCWAPRA